MTIGPFVTVLDGCANVGSARQKIVRNTISETRLIVTSSSSFLFHCHFRWVVSAFKFKCQIIISSELAFVAAPAFDPLEFPGPAHQAPASFGVGWPLFPIHRAHTLPCDLLAIVIAVHFKTMGMQGAFHLLRELDCDSILTSCTPH